MLEGLPGELPNTDEGVDEMEARRVRPEKIEAVDRRVVQEQLGLAHVGQAERAGRPDVALARIAVDHGDLAVKTEKPVGHIGAEKSLAAVHFAEHEHDARVFAENLVDEVVPALGDGPFRNFFSRVREGAVDADFGAFAEFDRYFFVFRNLDGLPRDEGLADRFGRAAQDLDSAGAADEIETAGGNLNRLVGWDVLGHFRRAGVFLSKTSVGQNASRVSVRNRSMRRTPDLGILTRPCLAGAPGTSI